jgi:hypothetical protein
MSNDAEFESSEEILRFAQEQGWTTEEIVRQLSGSLSYRKALEVARDWAPLLGLTVTEFMQMRKNE